MNECDGEPVLGLPERLPAGETILWQGAPAWKPFARHGLHERKLAVYFALLTVWNAVSTLQAGRTVQQAMVSATWAIGLGAAALLLITLFAWLVGRSTVYTITNKRVVMRFGIAMPMSVNYPFALVDGAGLKLHAEGTGDIPLAMRKGSKLSYMILWPHARPWRFANPEPMMRAIPEADRVARILARALTAAAHQPATAPADLAVPIAAKQKQAAAVA
jgi:hypothetical protein